jgi:hypothetical protein
VGRWLDGFLEDYRAGRIVGEHAVASMAERALENDRAEAAGRRRRVSASAGDGPDDDDGLGEFAHLWPPKTAAEADQRREIAAAAAAQRLEAMSDDELIEHIFGQQPGAAS